jgi:cell division protein FtsA
METRIGYPSEHLAKSPNDEISKPMHATGVGLVIKGFNNRRRKIETGVTGHSNKNRGGFFEQLVQKSWTFFENDNTE